MDYKAKPVRFVLGYFFPQILVVISLMAVLAVINPWFLLALISLLALAPIPAPFRKKIEMRGYGMSIKAYQWRNNLIINDDRFNYYVDKFITSDYYYMWPFPESIKEELRGWITDDSCVLKSNPAYYDVHRILAAQARDEKKE